MAGEVQIRHFSRLDTNITLGRTYLMSLLILLYPYDNQALLYTLCFIVISRYFLFLVYMDV